MDILNSDWTITVVGGIISTVVGTLIANVIQNSNNQSSNWRCNRLDKLVRSKRNGEPKHTRCS